MKVKQRKNTIARSKAIALITVIMMLASLTSMAAAFMDYELNETLCEYAMSDYGYGVNVEPPVAELPVVEAPEYEDEYGDDASTSCEEPEYDYYFEYNEYEPEELCECECECDYYDYECICECECGCLNEGDYIDIMPLSTTYVSNWSELQAAFNVANMPTSGPYIVEVINDIDMPFGITLSLLSSRNITLTSSNGYTLTRSTGTGRHFTVANSTLTVRNITLCGNGANSEDTIRGGIQVSTNGRLYLEDGGTITGNRATVGGGVSVTNIGSEVVFVMYGGVIRDNAASLGGGVSLNGTLNAPGIFTMHGGEIRNNNASSSGGGVNASMSHIEMFGGIISNNIANGTATAQGGGGVGVNGGTTFYGTPDAIYTPSIFVMHNGVISGNTAINLGGGIRSSGSIVTMNGGLISENTADIGGGVYGRTIAHIFTMNGGTISDNTAHISGGGIHNGGGGLSNLNYGTISGNIAHGTATADGGGGLSCISLIGVTIHPNVIFSDNAAATGLRINDSLNRTHNIEANGRINPGDWTGRPDVPHAFNNNDIRTISEVIDLTYHNVTFNLHGGTGDFPNQTVPNNGTATEPTTIPTLDNHTFVGWFTAATGGTAFNFYTPITTNTIIHARWEADSIQFEPCCPYCCLGYYDCADPCDCECDYDEPIPTHEYRYIRLYYVIDSDNIDDVVINPMMSNYPAGYTHRVNTAFALTGTRAVDRNALPGDTVYEFEGWYVFVGLNFHPDYLDFDTSVLTNLFIVPPASATGSALSLEDSVLALYDLDILSEASGYTITLFAVWTVSEAGGTPPPHPHPTPTPPPTTGGGNQKGGLPATGIENDVVLWSVLLGIALMAAIGAKVWINKSKK